MLLCGTAGATSVIQPSALLKSSFANGFYEWRKPDKQLFAIGAADDEEPGLRS